MIDHYFDTPPLVALVLAGHRLLTEAMAPRPVYPCGLCGEEAGPTIEGVAGVCWRCQDAMEETYGD